MRKKIRGEIWKPNEIHKLSQFNSIEITNEDISKRIIGSKLDDK